MSGECVLVIDDDPVLLGQMRRILERAGATVRAAASGAEGLRVLYRTRPDLVILDVAMPGLDGWTTLERIRHVTDVPILMLSGRDAELEKVRGLRAGADDYVTKPFSPPELLARIEALLRRRRNGHGAEPHYEDSLVEIDFGAAEARVLGRPLALSPQELRLLTAFVRHPGQVLSTDQLLALAWGDRDLPRERVKIYVSYLRDKFRAQHVEEPPIRTVRGFGYRYDRPA